MCGIVGYLGPGDAKKIIIDGLKKLEYRGYDSWGIGLREKKDFKVIKKIGKISEVDSDKILSKANLAIGHTRWATHGGVTTANAHPHADCRGKIFVVHNGIIENHEILREKLKQLGHHFTSQTDTEIIPHLIEEYAKKKPFLEALRMALEELKGNFALCLVAKGDPKLYVAANGCPLAIGVEGSEKYVASDILAFGNRLSQAIFLSDGSLAEIGRKIKIIDIKTGRNKRFVFKKIARDQNDAVKGHYQHFLFKEINEQPTILEKIAEFDSREIETIAALIRNSFGTFMVACGTAYHAALVGSYLFAQNAGMHINAISAGEFPNFQSFLTERTLLFTISQSGETADVLEAMKSAKSRRTKVLALVNNPHSTLARLADATLITPAGPEIAVLSTKAFTSQIAILFLLSRALNGLESAREILKKSSLSLQDTLGSRNIIRLRDLAARLKKVENLFAIGRGLNFPTALEAALKIKEVSYIHAEGFAGADLKHGPIALIEKGTPCLVFAAEDEVKDEILSNAMEVKSRGGYIIGVAPKNNKVFNSWIKVADIPEISPILNIIPIQVLAYFLAVERGLDPDQPRNLAKSVTVK